MSAGQRYPPKKKHANKPRPIPRPPLSEVEKKWRAYREMEKALVHLDEAEKLATWGGAPNACVHAAYYAMHHAARAALFVNGGVGKLGDVPLSHEHVIEHYGKLVQGETGDLQQSGLWLTRARSDRTIGDYDLNVNVEPDDAAETAKDAKMFLAACQARWQFLPPAEPPDAF